MIDAPHGYFDGFPFSLLSGAASMVKNALPSGENGEPTIGQLLKKWGHVSATVSIAIFAVQQWESSTSAREAMSTRITVLEESAKQTVEKETAQDTSSRQAISDLSHRLDLHRIAIDQLQSEIFAHIQHDDVIYQRRKP